MRNFEELLSILQYKVKLPIGVQIKTNDLRTTGNLVIVLLCPSVNVFK